VLREGGKEPREKGKEQEERGKTKTSCRRLRTASSGEFLRIARKRKGKRLPFLGLKNRGDDVLLTARKKKELKVLRVEKKADSLPINLDEGKKRSSYLCFVQGEEKG